VAIGLVLLIVGSIGMVRARRHTAAPPAGGKLDTIPVSTSTTELPSIPGPFAAGRHAIRGFGEVRVTVRMADGTTKVFCMMEATSEAQQARGLMTVRDTTLGGYDGMLFVFPGDIKGGFWMRNTPMPLSIAYVDGDGRLVSSTDMAPCGDTDSCPTYSARRPYRMAIEVPQGHLVRLGLGPSAKLEVGGACMAA
jgi:hypothetical protein